MGEKWYRGQNQGKTAQVGKIGKKTVLKE